MSPLLRACGLTLLRTKDYESAKSRERACTRIARDSIFEDHRSSDFKIKFVVFSKDRPIQLHALLASFYRFVKGSFSIDVLFAATTPAQEKAYHELRHSLSETCPIGWNSESNFKHDLTRILETEDCSHICFLVDDIVFIRPIEIGKPLQDSLLLGVLSLRLGSNCTYCYTKDAHMPPPPLLPYQTSELRCFDWRSGTYDWAYPLSLDGHVFPLQPIRSALAELDYRAPNSMERALQSLKPLFDSLPGFCFEQPRLLNIPLNRVQNEIHNLSGNVTTEFLLQRWNAGLMIDLENLNLSRVRSPHCELQVSFVPRTTATCTTPTSRNNES